MDFGKLAHIGRVDFGLPELGSAADRRSLAVIARGAAAAGARAGSGARAEAGGAAAANARSERASGSSASSLDSRVRVGCPVWAERAWLGRIYPLGTPPAEFLREYSRQFGMIELNTTHYRSPTPEAVVAWRDQTPPGFKFCPKWPQEISHHRQLVDCDPLVAMFCDSISRLGDRLGTTFLQLPPEFAPNRLPNLARFLSRLPRGFPLCVEFRHSEWFEDHALIPAVLDLLERSGVGTVITEVAGRRDVAHLSITAQRVFIRFVGNELDPTDTSRIEDWIPRIRSWLESGLRELYFCAHEPDNVLAPDLAAIFIERMNALANAGLRRWEMKDQGTQLGFGAGF